jgi:hypothetical protein
MTMASQKWMLKDALSLINTISTRGSIWEKRKGAG